jgi:hypothetical protein
MGSMLRRLTVAMIEMSSKTRKNAKHKGIITSQSLRPESHCTSTLGSVFAASDIARSASAATDFSLDFVAWASPRGFSGSNVC